MPTFINPKLYAEAACPQHYGFGYADMAERGA